MDNNDTLKEFIKSLPSYKLFVNRLDELSLSLTDFDKEAALRVINAISAAFAEGNENIRGIPVDNDGAVLPDYLKAFEQFTADGREIIRIPPGPFEMVKALYYFLSSFESEMLRRIVFYQNPPADKPA